MFCAEQVAQLRREIDTIRGRGADLVVIGNGNRHFASGFREKLGLETPLYVDTKRASYHALGMKRGVLRSMGPHVVKHAWRALRAGFGQRMVQGDPWQMGGVLVVLPGGRVAYRYLSEIAGDHPPVPDILAALPSSPG